MSDHELSEADLQAAQARRAAFIDSLPKAAVDAEDSLPGVIAGLNASTRSKLQRVYAIADDLAKAREPFVACRRGCAACCHMNVSITKAEAERMGAAIGRSPVPLQRSVVHAQDAFAEKACPFLDPEGACSIYAHRPLACRKHASFFTDAAACDPGVMNEVEVPMVAFSGLDQALFAATGERGQLVLADIRDFFPSSN